MTVTRTIVLLPGHGLQDCPGQLTGDAAAEMLAAWTTAWHPALVHKLGIPKWYAADHVSFEREGSLLLVPSAARGWLPADFLHDASASGAVVVDAEVQRLSLERHLLGSINLHHQIAEELVADFYAFGYWYLQIELLSYQLRYTSGLDPDTTCEGVLTAAERASAGDAQAARAALVNAFGILSDQRAHYYPVDSFVIDLTLVAKFNCGEPLRQELDGGRQRNVWMTGQTLEAMAATEPQSLSMLRKAVHGGQVELIGGEWNELPTSLVPRVAIETNLRRGRAVFRELLGFEPKIFARRRCGLGPMWPELLVRANYAGAVHATFDDGSTPYNLQPRSRWQGESPATVDALRADRARCVAAGNCIGAGSDDGSIDGIRFRRHRCVGSLGRSTNGLAG